MGIQKKKKTLKMGIISCEIDKNYKMDERGKCKQQNYPTFEIISMK